MRLYNYVNRNNMMWLRFLGVARCDRLAFMRRARGLEALSNAVQALLGTDTPADALLALEHVRDVMTACALARPDAPTRPWDQREQDRDLQEACDAE